MAIDPITLGLISSGIGAGVKAFGIGEASQNQRRAMRELQRIQSQPLARYTQTQGMGELGGLARQDVYNPQGFTAGERAGFMQDVNRAANTSFQRGVNMAGGQLSRALQGTNTFNTLSALNRFAGQGAGLRRQMQGRGLANLGAVARNEQNLSNMNVQTDLQRRLMAEQAAGRAAQQWRDYEIGTVQGLGSDLLGAGLNFGLAGLMGYGGTGTEMPTTTTTTGLTGGDNTPSIMPSDYKLGDFSGMGGTRMPQKRYSLRQ